MGDAIGETDEARRGAQPIAQHIAIAVADVPSIAAALAFPLLVNAGRHQQCGLSDWRPERRAAGSCRVPCAASDRGW